MNRPRKVEVRADNGRRAARLEKAGTRVWTRDGVLWEVEEGSTRRGLLWYYCWENEEQT